MNNPLFHHQNNHNPAPFEVTVIRDETLDKYVVTLTILGKRYSRIEKARVLAIRTAQKMCANLEEAFEYTWEDNT